MELVKAINERRSIRKYQSYQITKEEIYELIKAGQMAPSWKNSQTPRYFVAHSDEAKAKIVDALPDFNKERAESASCVIVTAIKTKRSGYNYDGTPATHLGHGFECFDNGLAVENICLRAYDMGYGSLIMGLYDEKKIREIFEIPDDFAVCALVAIGKADICPEMPPRKEIEDILVIK
jgi:nitroreductase